MSCGGHAAVSQEDPSEPPQPSHLTVHNALSLFPLGGITSPHTLSSSQHSPHCLRSEPQWTRRHLPEPFLFDFRGLSLY